MKKMYALLVVLLPILAVYTSPFSGFDLGTFLVIIFGGLCIKKKVNILKNRSLLYVMIYTVILTMVMILLPNVPKYSSVSSIVVRTLRLIVMLFIMVIIGMGSYFNHDVLIEYLRYVTMIVAIYAIIQLIFFNFTGMKLVNVFGPTKQGVVFEPLLGEYEEMYRPPSLFLEPSSVTYYVVPYLCYSLFHDYKDKKDKRHSFIDAIVISISILCTTSGQGMIILFGLWIIWFFMAFRRINFKKIFIGVPIFVVVLISLSTNKTIQYTINRLVSDESGGQNAVYARYGGYRAFNELSNLYKAFGTGYGNYNENVYYSSFADILFCTGIIGLALVLLMYFNLFRRGCLYQRILVIASLGLMLGGGVYSATYLCFYLPILLDQGRKYDETRIQRRIST